MLQHGISIGENTTLKHNNMTAYSKGDKTRNINYCCSKTISCFWIRSLSLKTNFQHKWKPCRLLPELETPIFITASQACLLWEAMQRLSTRTVPSNTIPHSERRRLHPSHKMGYCAVAESKDAVTHQRGHLQRMQKSTCRNNLDTKRTVSGLPW